MSYRSEFIPVSSKCPLRRRRSSVLSKRSRSSQSPGSLAIVWVVFAYNRPDRNDDSDGNDNVIDLKIKLALSQLLRDYFYLFIVTRVW